LSEAGITLSGVRLDSGDLAAHAREVRRILDTGGLDAVRIFASGGIDEDAIAGFVASGAPIDGYGVGTSLVTSEDAPALDCAYKMQEYAGIPRRKHSEGKATWPGRKQVFRQRNGDVLTVVGGDQEGEPLIHPVMRAGKIVAPLPSLAQIRTHAAAELAKLPEHLARLQTEPPYPVEVAPALRRLADEADRRLAAE
jgi:nicotinate phosphoribosyltransferase